MMLNYETKLNLAALFKYFKDFESLFLLLPNDKSWPDVGDCDVKVSTDGPIG